jgi:hypothetical protein
MAIVSDFTVILKDSTTTIGDSLFTWSQTFQTDNVNVASNAYLALMVKGLTSATQDVDVQLNGGSVGTIFRNTGGDPTHWQTQIINIGSGILLDTSVAGVLNELVLNAVPVTGGGGAGNNFDDFSVRDIVCHFKEVV